MKRYIKTTTDNIPEVYSFMFCNKDMRREIITAASNSRDFTSNMVRCRSSNMWAYNMNIRDRHDRTGDLYVQFKNKNGGPGEVYMYLDVPVNVYNKLVTAPSKGHFLYEYIKGKYRFRKLTGDKRTKQAGGIN